MFLILFNGFLGLFLLASSLIRFSRKNAIAFLHPYCEMGGGGEAVLWRAVNAARDWVRKDAPPGYSIYIYTTVMDELTLKKAKQNIKDRFGFDLNAPENVDIVKFVHIRSRSLLEPKWYPRFTLFGQFLGGIVVSLECLIRLNPVLLIESTGIPGAFPVFKLIGGAEVLVYMHYPTITPNMIQRVSRGEEMYNNAGFIARNWLLSFLKYYYYVAFAIIYGLCGRCVNKVLVNGTFTMRHIEKLWPFADVVMCYPPVALKRFNNLKSNAETLFEKTNQVNILSLGQFRPEKNHRSQLETLNILKNSPQKKFCLIMAGGVRNEDDQRIVDDLRQYADKLKLVENVDYRFVLNTPLDELLKLMSDSMFGIHTMIDEHFGIALVEMMAGKMIVVAHESGGPLFDIVGNKNGTAGFLGKGARDYADIILDVVHRGKEKRETIRLAASEKTSDFSEMTFEDSILCEISKLLPSKYMDVNMKLFMIMILFKDKESGKITVLKKASDLSSFGFFHRSTVENLMTFTGCLFAERSSVPSRQTMTEKEYRIRCYIRPDGLAGISVTDEEYEDRVSFTMLSKVLEEFSRFVPASSWPTLKENECKFDKLPELLKKWQNPREADSLMRVQDEVEETTIVMHNTIQSVLQRGERLDDIVAASERLSEQSKMFYTQARQMNKCCNYV